MRSVSGLQPIVVHDDLDHVGLLEDRAECDGNPSTRRAVRDQRDT